MSRRYSKEISYLNIGVYSGFTENLDGLPEQQFGTVFLTFKTFTEVSPACFSGADSEHEKESTTTKSSKSDLTLNNCVLIT